MTSPLAKLPRLSLRQYPFASYLAFVGLLCALIAGTGSVVVKVGERPVVALMRVGDQELEQIAPVIKAAAVLEGDSWMQSLRSSFQEKDRRMTRLGGNTAPPADEGLRTPLTRSDESVRRSSSKTYRTVCVRLCDGFFFPVSFATTSDQFEADEAKCASRCTSPAKLYVYANPGEEPEEMVSVSGQPYAKLSTAFLFRTKIDQACKCAPHPWEPEAMARHQRYAEAAEQEKQAKRAAQQAASDKDAARGANKKTRGASLTPAAPSGMGQQAKLPDTAGRLPPGPRFALLNAAETTTSDALPALTPMMQAPTAAAETADAKSVASDNTRKRRQAANAKSRPAPPMRLGAVAAKSPPAARAASNWQARAFEPR